LQIGFDAGEPFSLVATTILQTHARSERSLPRRDSINRL
jgi:hypothetical protein